MSKKFTSKAKVLLLFPMFSFLVACNPTKPTVHYASENTISLQYNAYAMTTTVSAEAIDMAAKHCNKYGKGFKLVSSTAHAITTEETHTFMCTNDFVDERIEIKVKN